MTDYPEAAALSPDYSSSSRYSRDAYGRSSQDPSIRSSSHQNHLLYGLDLYGPTASHRDLYSMSSSSHRAEDPYASTSTSKPRRPRASRNARDNDPLESSYRSLPSYSGGRETSRNARDHDPLESSYRSLPYSNGQYSSSSSTSGRYPGDRISLLTEPLHSGYSREKERESSRRREDLYRDDQELSRYYVDPFRVSGPQTKRDDERYLRY